MLLGAWIVFTTGVVQAVTWLIEQISVIEGLSFAAPAWPAAVWINAALAGTPAILLATTSRRATTRAVGRSWSIATLMLGIVGSVRAIPAQQNLIYLAVLAATTLVAAFVLQIVWRDRRPGNGSSILLGLAAGIFVFVPWLWVGALGSPLESALAVVAAAGCGWLAALTLSPILDTYASQSSRWTRVLVGGLAAGVALTPLAAAFAGSGPHLALILLLPALGIVAAALGPGILATAALIGVAVLGPLAFVEPDETGLILGFHDVGYWALIGALISFAIGLLFAIGALTGRRPNQVAGTVALVLAAASAIVVYPLAGHPGFFGEQLFVVMKQQADVGAINATGTPAQKRASVYAYLTAFADRTQAPLRAELRRDGLSFTPYYLLNGILVDDGEQARIWLSRRDDVDRVLLNPRLRPIPSAGAPMTGDLPAPTGPEWNIAEVKAPAVWATGDTGRGIVIGGSDTGVDRQHPALMANFRGGTDSWYDPWNGASAPVDEQGHGTHTMGSAVGSGGIGVAPGALWMACVNLGRNMANPAYYLDCMQFMLAPFGRGGNAFAGDPSRGADIQTNSWGCPPMEGCDARSLQPAVNALAEAGVFFVAAAGNEGPRCGSIDDAPAPYPATFTVGAVDRHGDIASFSSRSSATNAVGKPDLVAPGVDVVSALPGGGYGSLDGTSMATPQVAGVVALMWSANPALRGDVAETARILRQTTQTAYASADSDPCTGPAQIGSGLVNAAGAVAMARNVID